MPLSQWVTTFGPTFCFTPLELSTDFRLGEDFFTRQTRNCDLCHGGRSLPRQLTVVLSYRPVNIQFHWPKIQVIEIDSRLFFQ